MTVSYNTNIIYRLLQIKGIGPAFVNKLVGEYKRMGDQHLLDQYMQSHLTQLQLDGYANADSVNSVTSEQVMSVLDDEYPSCLISFLRNNTPPLIYIKGNKGLLGKKKVAFSGSRHASDAGLSITENCAADLAQMDYAIVSGYAKGVDMTAHAAALRNGGSTIIVLPNGIDRLSIAPELRELWDEDRILVVSEFNPSDAWTPGRAMQRNSTIIGLSDAVVVVEAGRTGGSLDAGRKTLAGGKSLFVPDFTNPAESALGNRYLIQEGAIALRRNATTRRPNIQPIVEALTIVRTAYSGCLAFDCV